MSSRTVRLDQDGERILAEILRARPLSVSAALQQGLLALRDSLRRDGPATVPHSVYRTIDLGKGGTSRSRARAAKRDVRAVIEKKVRR
ncbi:MAG TPA: hypothetical protein VF103_12880 [Polyangiaceae bacterium]